MGAAILTGSGDEISRLLIELDAIGAAYGNEAPFIVESPPVTIALGSGGTLAAEIETFEQRRIQLLAEANDLATLADVLRAETTTQIAGGDNLLEAGGGLLQEPDYLQARDEIMPNALELAVSALALEWEVEFASQVEQWMSTFAVAIVDARAALLRREPELALADAEGFLLENAESMQHSQYLDGLATLDPVQSRLDTAEAFKPDPQFASGILDDIEELQARFVDASATTLRAVADDRYGAAKSFFESVGDRMQQDQHQLSLQNLEPIREAFEAAETFDSNASFASSMSGAIAALESDINDARATTLRAVADDRYNAARSFFDSVGDQMQQDQHQLSLQNLDPVREAFEAAEAFDSNAAFASSMSAAIVALESDINDTRADTLRNETVAQILVAEEFLAAQSDTITEARYIEALGQIPPVEQRLESAEAFMENAAFRDGIETRISTFLDGASEARAAVLRGETERLLAEAEAFLDDAGEIDRTLFDSRVSRAAPVSQALEIAEDFKPDPQFRASIESRLSLLDSAFVAAHSVFLQQGTRELLSVAIDYVESTKEAMGANEYSLGLENLGPVRDALAVSETFLENDEFRDEINNEIDLLAAETELARSDQLQRLTLAQLDVANLYLKANRINMDETEYETALSTLGPVTNALEVSDSFREDTEFRTEVEDEVRRIEDEIRLSRSEQLREEAGAFLARAAESSESGIAAANRDEVTSATEEFGNARVYLQQATSLTGEANEVLSDPPFSASIDSRVADISRRIEDAEIAIVVREVRILITDTQDSYGAGEYELAYGFISEAENRWADASTEGNTEIEYWFTIVNNARQALSGREIDENDPKYDTIRQLLNNALSEFETGRNLLEEGQESEAQLRFDGAEDQLLVVRGLFPLNQEARILDLQISKLTSSDDEYQRLLDDAVEDATRRLEEDTPEAYATLTDIREIEPSYPGLSAAILEAEYQLGVRERPLDPVLLARALSLLSQATAIFEEYRSPQIDPVVRTSQFERALDLLDQALADNPRLSAASQLKDSLNASVGGNVVYALASEAQRQFELARDLYIEENNATQAFLITSALIRDEANQGFKPLLDLHSRLQEELL